MSFSPRRSALWAGVLWPALPAFGQAQSAKASGGLDALSASAVFDTAKAMASDAVIELRLNRPLTRDEGELVLVVGGTDVTAVSRRSDSGIVYRPDAIPLPGGTTELVLYRRAGGRWREIKRFSMNVLQGTGLTHVTTTKSATVGNKGQLAEGRSRGIPEPERRTFQDFVLNAGVRSAQERPGWSLTTQSNYVAVTRRQEALRFRVKGGDAPKLDLSDYLVSLRNSRASLSVGHVSFGTSRHLANGFAARGGTVAWSSGLTTMTLGAMNGSSQVGWANLIGLDQPSNRLFGASISHDAVRSHPGMLRLELTLLNGAKLPITSFTQSAVVDAEQSEGGSMQLGASLPNQRLRFLAGYTRSRFDNPRRDAQLASDSTVRRVQPVTRGARFVELNAIVLQNVRLPLGAPANMAIGWRHERVDPLYRSIAAPTAADRQQHSADATVSVGALTGQFSETWTRDNLARVASILTTNGLASVASMAIPLALLTGIRRHAALLPMITLAGSRTHQFADAMPTNGAFRDTDLPNQVSLNGDVAALWQLGRWRLTMRANRSLQDNREPLRERADFAAGVQALSAGMALGAAGDLSVDVGNETQTARERNETTRVRRLTVNGSFRPRPTTSILAALSAVRNQPPAASATFNSDQRLEVSQGLGLGRSSGGAPRAQFFLRYARTTARQPVFAAANTSGAFTGQQQWSIASGLNLLLF